MNKNLPSITTVLIVILIVSTILWWLASDPAVNVSERIPGMDHPPGAARETASSTEAVIIGQYFEKFDAVPSEIKGSWPGFRGPNRDNIVAGSCRLRENWQEDLPEILWRVKLGDGHAAPAVNNGRVYLLDYDEERRADVLRCLSLENGGEIWRRWYNVRIKRNHGMSRTVPAVTDEYVVTIGPMCHVMCVRAGSGDLLWGVDLVREYGTEVPMWYTGQCPLIDGKTAVIAPCGTNTLMAGIDCGSGRTLWTVENRQGWKMSHSSIMPAEVHGRKMYIYAAIGGIIGVSAGDEDRGTVLWETSEWKKKVVAPSPVITPDGRLFITAGYGEGSVLFQVAREGETFSVNKIKEFTVTEALACEQQTPVLVDDYMFGILPKDAGAERKQFVCAKIDEPGKYIWTSGKTHRFGLGPFLLADGKFLILDDEGELTMIRESRKGYEETARAKFLNGHDSWGPMALVSGLLLMRDSTEMVCVDLRVK